jgi:hypothetical protein
MQMLPVVHSFPVAHAHILYWQLENCIKPSVFQAYQETYEKTSEETRSWGIAND